MCGNLDMKNKAMAERVEFGLILLQLVTTPMTVRLSICVQLLLLLYYYIFVFLGLVGN